MTITVGGTNITFSNSTNQATAYIGEANYQVFSSSGTFTVPTGITQVKVYVFGGGGGGAGSDFGSIQGRTGINGSTGVAIVTGLTPGASIAVTVGAGGNGGNGGSNSVAATNGAAGGTSSFGSYVSAAGGPATAASNTYSASTIPAVTFTSCQKIYGYSDRKSTRLNSSHMSESRMPSSA